MTTTQLPAADVLLDLLPDAVCVVDPEGRFLYVSAAFQSLFGYAPGQVLGLSMETLIHPDDLAATRHAAAQVMADRPLPNYRNRYRHQLGHYVHVQWSARWLPEHGIRLAIAHEVGTLREREQALEHQALHDPLTGLPNRTHLTRELALRIQQADAGGPALTLLYLDLDGFKATNDRHGHETGDRLLVRVAERLREGLREHDFIARLGGDEFVVLLRDCASPDKARAVAESLQALLAGVEAVGPQRLGASIGIAHHPADGRDPAGLLQTGDHRMYLAKGGSRRGAQ